MTGPCLTIVTITKDDAAGLARTLASTAALRSEPGVEHLVVHAGEVVAGSAGPNVTWLRQKSTGIAGAFNEGLHEARGAWVWFLNGGDAIHERLDPRWLLHLLSQTQAELVSGAVQYDGDDAPRRSPPLRMQWPLSVSWLPHPSTLVRREALLAVGGFDPRWQVCMDFDLWYRLLSREAMADLVAVPFARFDVNGVSNRPAARPLLLRENAAVLWRHKAVILRTSWQKARRIVYMFYYAATHRWFDHR